MHRWETVLVNGTHKILDDFEIKTEGLIQTRQTDLVVKKKKTNLLSSRFCRSFSHRMKIKESKNIENTLTFSEN